MKLDDLARQAAEEVRRHSRSLPLPDGPRRQARHWLAPALATAGVIVVAVGLAVLIRALPTEPTPAASTTTTESISTTTTTPPTTKAPLDLGPRLPLPPAEPHIQLGLTSATLILSLEGELVGHIQPPLTAPEQPEARQQRLGQGVTVPDGCAVDAVLEPGASFLLVCSREPEGPSIVRMTGAALETLAALPPNPSATRVPGLFRSVFLRPDGRLLAQYSGECEIPYALVVEDGVARHVNGVDFWDATVVPNSYAYGWLPDGRALVFAWSEAFCGAAHPQPGLYAYDLEGQGTLLHPMTVLPLWGRIADSPVTGVPAQRWLRGEYAVGVTGSDGTVFTTDSLLSYGTKMVAWDGSDGLVYLSSAGELSWWRPAGDDVVAHLGIEEQVSIVDVTQDGNPVAVLERGEALIAFDLVTGEERPKVPAGYVRLDYGNIRRSASGRSAYIEKPDWSGVELDEAGGAIPPFPLPQLVITDRGGAVLARIEVGSYEEPYATLHDFDGRRVIVSIEPHEPAAAPRTVYVIDLQCPSCTEVIFAGPDSFDLVGTLPWTGPVVAPDLAAAEEAASGNRFQEVYPILPGGEDGVRSALRHRTFLDPEELARTFLNQLEMPSATLVERVEETTTSASYRFRYRGLDLVVGTRVIGLASTGEAVWGVTYASTTTDDEEHNLSVSVREEQSGWRAVIFVGGLPEGERQISLRYGDWADLQEGASSASFLLEGEPEPWGILWIESRAPGSGELLFLHIISLPPGQFAAG